MAELTWETHNRLEELRKLKWDVTGPTLDAEAGVVQPGGPYPAPHRFVCQLKSSEGLEVSGFGEHEEEAAQAASDEAFYWLEVLPSTYKVDIFDKRTDKHLWSETLQCLSWEQAWLFTAGTQKQHEAPIRVEGRRLGEVGDEIHHWQVG